MAESLDLGEEKKSSKKLVFLIAGGLAAVALIIGATLYFAGFFNSGEQEEGEQEQPTSEDEIKVAAVPIYASLDPVFIVNFPSKSGIKYLQVSISVLAYQQEVVDALTKHMPMVRNNLLMVLGAQDPALLKKKDGKDRLRQQVLEALQKIIEEKEALSGLEAVFFTSLVMQ